MLSGKYWIIGHHCADVSTSEHALYARNFMLRLQDSPERLTLNKDLFAALPAAELEKQRRRGIGEDVLKFLAQPENDARLYVIENLQWIRTRQDRFYLWELNARSWRTLRDCEAFWIRQPSATPDDTVLIWEVRHERWGSTSVRNTRTARTFSAFKRGLKAEQNASE